MKWMKLKVLYFLIHQLSIAYLFIRLILLPGPLHGLPISVKDNCDVEGMDSTLGFAKNLHQEANSNANLLKSLMVKFLEMFLLHKSETVFTFILYLYRIWAVYRFVRPTFLKAYSGIKIQQEIQPLIYLLSFAFKVGGVVIQYLAKQKIH
jgi:hypothetical protein